MGIILKNIWNSIQTMKMIINIIYFFYSFLCSTFMNSSIIIFRIRTDKYKSFRFVLTFFNLRLIFLDFEIFDFFGQSLYFLIILSCILHSPRNIILKHLLPLRIPRPNIPAETISPIALTFAESAINKMRQILRINIL